ncbi:hypothetical protein PVAP13_4KG123700 [Panicum virgatum]|uniref:BURP domain-containing protein n=1 Tax=Panicum virgatum TaxID=38727 RepID=A0A8T0TNE2_PANVG|nr:hypothetical protein PVAP13_4KG123700 [Panicum virgatum]
MGVLLCFVSLLVVVASGGKCAALVTGAKGNTMLYYASRSELNTYWQSVFPNRPIPSAILSHFSARSVSVSMARDMWSTLSSCEHPREVVGEQKACATSLESMHKFVASALGTSSIHAFSTSLDVPEEGIASLSDIYKVAAMRALTTHGATKEPSNTVTCHSMSFPFVLFYCHAVNPTRIYEITLKKVKNGVVPAVKRRSPVVRALAVCHVDTSGFDPTLNYWVKLGLKPGQASVCHFLTRGDVLWTPTLVA